MFESGAALTTGRHAGGAVSRARLEVTIILLSLVLLIAGTVASLGIENRWSDVISNHLGGLGLGGSAGQRAEEHQARQNDVTTTGHEVPPGEGRWQGCRERPASRDPPGVDLSELPWTA